MKTKILVIGATGLIGKAVANQLYTSGYQVIVMSRNREKAQSMFSDDVEVIEADVLKPETIRYSFQGVDGVYINLPEKDVPAAMPNILKTAKEAGVRQLLYTSGCTVREENAWHPMIRGHFEGEKAIEQSGIPYTILKLTMVMDMIPRYANNGKPFIIGKQEHGWSWIHSEDIAKMASMAFESPKAKSQKFTLWGKEKTTIAQAVDKYNSVFFPKAKKVKSKPYWIANLLALLVGEKLKYAISIFKYFEDHPEEGNPEKACQILGEPSMSLNRFFELEKSKMA